MIIVTGGAGFIGSNIVKALNDMGRKDILVVDNLKDGTKFINLVDLDIADYCDKEDFIASIIAGDDLGDIDAVFHEGACSATTKATVCSPRRSASLTATMLASTSITRPIVEAEIGSIWPDTVLKVKRALAGN